MDVDGSVELYVLEKDPEETANLAAGHDEALQRGRALLDEQQNRTKALRRSHNIQEFSPLDLLPAQVERLKTLGYF